MRSKYILKKKPSGWFGSQRGNVFTMLFGAVGMVGVIGVGVSQMASGPLKTARTVTSITSAEADIVTNSSLISMKLNQMGVDADADNDGYVEPPVPVSCPTAPTGAGCLPTNLGAVLADPWGIPFAYCVWDHGDTTGSAGRLDGTTTTSGPILAIISAGPDRVFQTSCHAYSESGVDPEDINTIIQPVASGGADDKVRILTYEIAASAANVGELPDEACNSNTAGLMRYDMETLQICNGTEWTEVSGDAFSASGTFTPVTDAPLGTEYTSNPIVLENFLGDRTAEVTGGATLIINGVDRGTSTTIISGDSIALRASAASIPETTNTFELTVSAIRRQWMITTRARTPVNMSITPQNQTGMNVTGPGNPAYGTATVFIVRNSGETLTGALSNAAITNTTHFELVGVGDGCQGQSLGLNETCFIEIRPRASSNAVFNGTVTTGANGINVTANLSGSANGWICNLPWGGTINDGQNVTAYQSPSVPFGSSCISETRTCSGSTLTGSYTNQACSVQAPSNCNLPWGGQISHGSSVTAYQSSSVPFGSTCASQTRTCNNGSLSGSYTRSNCSVQPPPYTYSWAAGSYGSCSVSCGGGTQTRSVYCRRSDGATVSDSFCGGGKPSTSRSCNTQACCVSNAGNTCKRSGDKEYYSCTYSSGGSTTGYGGCMDAGQCAPTYQGVPFNSAFLNYIQSTQQCYSGAIQCNGSCQ